MKYDLFDLTSLNLYERNWERLVREVDFCMVSGARARVPAGRAPRYTPYDEGKPGGARASPVVLDDAGVKKSSPRTVRDQGSGWS